MPSIVGRRPEKRSLLAATVDGHTWLSPSVELHPQRGEIEAHEAIHRAQYAASEDGIPLGTRAQLESEAERGAVELGSGSEATPAFFAPTGMILAAPQQVLTSSGARIVEGNGGYLYRQEPDGTITILAGPTGAGTTHQPGSHFNVAITREIGPHPEASSNEPTDATPSGQPIEERDDEVIRYSTSKFFRFKSALGNRKISRGLQLEGEAFVDVRGDRIDADLRLKLARQVKIPFGESTISPSIRLDGTVSYIPSQRKITLPTFALSAELSQEQQIGPFPWTGNPGVVERNINEFAPIKPSNKVVVAFKGSLRPPNRIPLKGVADLRFVLEASLGGRSTISGVVKLLSCDLGSVVVNLGPAFPDLPDRPPTTVEELVSAATRLVQSIQPSIEDPNLRLDCKQVLFEVEGGLGSHIPRGLLEDSPILPDGGNPLPGESQSPTWPFF